MSEHNLKTIILFLINSWSWKHFWIFSGERSQRQIPGKVHTAHQLFWAYRIRTAILSGVAAKKRLELRGARGCTTLNQSSESNSFFHIIYSLNETAESLLPFGSVSAEYECTKATNHVRMRGYHTVLIDRDVRPNPERMVRKIETYVL